MQQDFSSYDYSVQIGESSTGTGEPSNLNRGTKRSLESENQYYTKSTVEIYPCIKTEMIFLDEYVLSLDFDPENLLTEADKYEVDKYLDEICIRGRTTLFDHFIIKKGKKQEQANALIENYKFSDISISPTIEGGYTSLFNAFHQRHREIIK